MQRDLTEQERRQYMLGHLETNVHQRNLRMVQQYGRELGTLLGSNKEARGFLEKLLSSADKDFRDCDRHLASLRGVVEVRLGAH